MKKNIVIGGIICLILAVFRLCSLIYSAVVFENFYPEYILDIVLILTCLIIPGIIGLFGKGNSYYYITSFLGAGYCFFFGLQNMTTYYSDRYVIQGLLYILLSIGYLVLFILDKCKINDKTHYSYVLSYIGFFCFITMSVYPLILYVRRFPFSSDMPLTNVVLLLAVIHIYIIAIVTSSFVIVAKFKHLWVSILALSSICVYLLLVLFNIDSGYGHLPIFYVLEILITLFGIIFIPFSFVARKVLNNEAEESTTQSNQDVFESVPNDTLEPYEEDLSEEEPYEEESYSDSDLDEEKLLKLKSFYEKGLIDEKEYAELRKDVLMKILK